MLKTLPIKNLYDIERIKQKYIEKEMCIAILCARFQQGSEL